MNDATQSPVRFGAGNSLVGMVTTPAHQAPATTACLMFNMGANHRVGPRRINVKLAHSLAARGMASLRFDLGGVGDSDAFDSAHDLQTRSVHDLQAAMDLIERMLGIRQFVIVGMCSGVEHAVSVAAVDTRREWRLSRWPRFQGVTLPCHQCLAVTLGPGHFVTSNHIPL